MWFHPVPDAVDADAAADPVRAQRGDRHLCRHRAGRRACTRRSSPASVSSPPAAEPPVSGAVRSRGADPPGRSDPVQHVRRGRALRPRVGFFARVGGAGRAGGDFVTSPEVGPLFGALRGRARSTRVVASAGRAGSVRRDGGRRRHRPAVPRGAAGRARVRARAALRAGRALAGACARQATRAVAVEPLRARARPVDVRTRRRRVADAGRRESGPIVSALEELPALTVDGVVIANELLDNLAFDIVERTDDGWHGDPGRRRRRRRVPRGPGAARSEELVSVARRRRCVPVGTRIPVQRAVEEWIDDCATAPATAASCCSSTTRPRWTSSSSGPADGSGRIRAHERGGIPLDDPGSQDITADVLLADPAA